MTSHRRTQPLAVASLVAGILGSFLLPILGSITAIVTGHLARARIARGDGDGDGMAIAGLTLGWLSLAFWLLSAVLLLAFGIDTSSLVPTAGH